MFSVVIPLYNKELSITSTVQSVLSQTCQDFEIVIINDGSTDNSVKAVQDINDNRIRLIHQENQGVSAARNSGIKEAEYEWIAFLDGDDLWEPNHLDEVTKMMQLHPDEKVFVTSFAYSDNRPMYKTPRTAPIFKIENYFKEVIKENLMCSSIVVAYKNCFDDAGGFNEALKYGEDLDLWSRLASFFPIVKSIAITAIYRVDAENRSYLNQRLENCFEYHIKLENVTDKDKRIYLSFLINSKLFAYLRSGEIKTFIKLKKKQNNTLFALFLMRKFKGLITK